MKSLLTSMAFLLAERMQHFGHFEALLHQRFPESEIMFRNMGFPGHTPGFRPAAGQPIPWAFPEALKKFTAPEGDEVPVFATVKEFPNLGNPVQMRFNNG